MGTVGTPARVRLVGGYVRPLLAALAAEWREIGGLGRLATAGLAASGVVAVMLGMFIQGSVRHHLLDVRAELIEGVVDTLASDGLLPGGDGTVHSAAALDAAVEHRLIGGEVERVVIRDAAGTVLYGTPPDGPGHRLDPLAARHVEQHGDRLLHFRLPIVAAGGRSLGIFEVFQQATSLDAVLLRVRRNVWLSISSGLGSLGAAMGALTLSHARALDRRRRHAEELLRELLHVEDEQRRRIVGALHDDIGQPLYRVLYGLEGCGTRVRDQPEVAAELQRLGSLVRDVDHTLRDELRNLHRSSLEALDLRSALDAVARDCADESGLAVRLDLDVDREPSPVVRSVLLRAVEEALTNVRKHAAAHSVAIHARTDANRIIVQVSDDGRGCQGPHGLGLTTVRERLDAIGGCLDVGARPGGGTLFSVTVPTIAEVPA